MSKRTLSMLGAVVALVAFVGVTSALAGSSGRKAPAPTNAPAEPAAKAASSPATAAVVESSKLSGDAATYWTLERMKAATAPSMTVPGGSAKAAPPSLTPRSTTKSPASAAKAKPTKAVAPTKATSKTSQASSGAVEADAAQGAEDYWADQMGNAGPQDMGVPGGGSSDGADEPDIRTATP